MRLKLACEYLASPVFCPDLDKMGHVDVRDLPISNNLVNRINKWDDEYQATFNDEYPPNSGFATSDSKAQHMIEGKELARLLQQELGNDYVVEYVS